MLAAAQVREPLARTRAPAAQQRSLSSVSTTRTMTSLGSADAAGVGPVPTGGGFGTARIPPEPPHPRPTFRPSFTTGVGGGKGSGKSGDGGHRPTSYYDLPDRENPHRPLSGREARDYFRTWTPSEWKEFRRLYPRPPGQGRIIHIDEEMLK